MGLFIRRGAGSVGTKVLSDGDEHGRRYFEPYNRILLKKAIYNLRSSLRTSLLDYPIRRPNWRGRDEVCDSDGKVVNWLRVIRKLELSAKPHEHWV
jgi:hypothetical protein